MKKKILEQCEILNKFLTFISFNVIIIIFLELHKSSFHGWVFKYLFQLKCWAKKHSDPGPSISDEHKRMNVSPHTEEDKKPSNLTISTVSITSKLNFLNSLNNFVPKKNWHCESFESFCFNTKEGHELKSSSDSNLKRSDLDDKYCRFESGQHIWMMIMLSDSIGLFLKKMDQFWLIWTQID